MNGQCKVMYEGKVVGTCYLKSFSEIGRAIETPSGVMAGPASMEATFAISKVNKKLLNKIMGVSTARVAVRPVRRKNTLGGPRGQRYAEQISRGSSEETENQQKRRHSFRSHFQRKKGVVRG